jgi:hypothetical protein
VYFAEAFLFPILNAMTAIKIEKASDVLCSASPINETMPEIIPPIISATDKSILIANDKISNLTDFCVTSL